MENIVYRPVQDTSQQYLTARQGADLMCVGEVTFRKRAKDGVIPAGFKTSPRKTLWLRSDLIAFLESSR